MMSHQIAHQVVTSETAHEPRMLAEVAEILDETPLTRQLISTLDAAVVCPGGQS